MDCTNIGLVRCAGKRGEHTKNQIWMIKIIYTITAIDHHPTQIRLENRYKDTSLDMKQVGEHLTTINLKEVCHHPIGK
jgi:hypothetical protein